jgi:hypothetical protein
VAGVGEGVLGVELEVVELEGGEEIDGLEEVPHRGDAVAGDVEHDAAGGEGRGVFDVEGGRVVAVLAAELGEGVVGEAEAGLGAGGDEGAAGADVQGIGVGSGELELLALVGYDGKRRE